jgi:predicted nucleic-acid-binding protein
MRAIDTNVLVRLIVRDDVEQAAAADDFIANGAFVPSIVLAETVWVLTSIFGVGRDQLAAAIAQLLEHESLVIQDSDVAMSALAAFTTAKGVDYTDCLVLEAARKAGHGPLGTFDKRLARLPGTQRID